MVFNRLWAASCYKLLLWYQFIDVSLFWLSRQTVFIILDVAESVWCYSSDVNSVMV